MCAVPDLHYTAANRSNSFFLKNRATRLRRFQSETKSTKRWYILKYEMKLNLSDRGALKAIPGPGRGGMLKGSQTSKLISLSSLYYYNYNHIKHFDCIVSLIIRLSLKLSVIISCLSPSAPPVM